MNETLRVGLVGAGPMSAILAADLAEIEGVTVTAVCPGGEEDPHVLANSLGAVAYATIHELAAGEVDAVYVASNPVSHRTHAVTLLEAGKHVLVEKPLASSATDALAMIAAARAADRLLMELYPAPFEPNLAAIRAAVDLVPRVRRAVLVKDQYSSAFDAFKAGETPAAFDPDQGGGSVFDLGFYGVSLAVHLFGAPVGLAAGGVTMRGGVEVQGAIRLAYDEFEVECLHSKVASCGIDSQVAGEREAVVFDDISVPTRVQLKRQTPMRQLEVAEDFSVQRSGSHLKYGAEAFVEAVRAGQKDIALHPLANVVTTLSILDEALRLTRESPVGVTFVASLAGAEA